MLDITKFDRKGLKIVSIGKMMIPYQKGLDSRNLCNKNVRQERILDFAARGFPQYGNWSVTTFRTRLRIYSLLQQMCQTQVIPVQHKYSKYNTSPTWVRHKQHKCRMTVTRVQSKSDTNDNATQVKNFDFDNYMSDNIFSHPYISYTAKE